MVSRQYEWQLKQQSKGRCEVCGKEAVLGTRGASVKQRLCEFHIKAKKERNRKCQERKRGRKKL